MRQWIGHKFTRLAIVAALPFMGTGGCTDTVVIHNEISYAIDIESQLRYATNGYEMKTLIQGNPFDMTKDSLDGIVTTMMDGATRGPQVTFSTAPPIETPYHVVVRFNPTEWPRGEELCGAKPWSGGGSPSGDLRAAAAFCFGDQVLSVVRGRIGEVTGPDDPRFRSVVRQLTYFLFPQDEIQSGDRPRLMS